MGFQETTQVGPTRKETRGRLRRERVLLQNHCPRQRDRQGDSTPDRFYPRHQKQSYRIPAVLQLVPMAVERFYPRLPEGLLQKEPPPPRVRGEAQKVFTPRR